MSKDSTKLPSANSPKKRKTSLDYSELGTPEFQADLKKRAEDYPNVVKKRMAQLRGEALDEK